MIFLFDLFDNIVGAFQFFLLFPVYLDILKIWSKKWSLKYSSNIIFLFWPPFLGNKWTDALFHRPKFM